MSDKKEIDPMIMTGLNQVLVFEISNRGFFGIEMSVYGGPKEGTINLTPMMLRALSEMALNIADKMEEKP